MVIQYPSAAPTLHRPLPPMGSGPLGPGERQDLPKTQKPLHAVSGELQVEGCQEAPLDEAVSGDFYDCFTTDDGRLAVLIGDICGHGPQAAEQAAAVKSAVRTLLSRAGRPEQTLALFNEILCRQQISDNGELSPIALAIAVIDPLSGIGTVSSAGLEPALVLRGTGGWDVLEQGGLLLGVDADEVYPAETVHLQPGDLLLMVTDGITEARHGSVCLGYDGLTFLASCEMAEGEMDTTTGLAHLAQSILSRAQTYAGGAFHDDACLLTVRHTRPVPDIVF